jgi:hypothetical protein
MNRLEGEPKTIFNIGGDHLTPSMGIVLSIHALHFRKTVSIGK